MAFLLDTDTVSYLIRKNHSNHQAVLDKLLSHHHDDINISTITACELYSGLHRVPNNQKAFKSRIKIAMDNFLSSINILDFDYLAASIYGEIRAALITKGKDIGMADCLIAAHAVSERLVLVTNNVKHFSRIKDLSTENWC